MCTSGYGGWFTTKGLLKSRVSQENPWGSKHGSLWILASTSSTGPWVVMWSPERNQNIPNEVRLPSSLAIRTENDNKVVIKRETIPGNGGEKTTQPWSNSTPASQSGSVWERSRLSCSGLCPRWLLRFPRPHRPWLTEPEGDSVPESAVCFC